MKNEILEKIEGWNKKIAKAQKDKAKLEKEILMIDIFLNNMMCQYDDLFRKLFKNK